MKILVDTNFFLIPGKFRVDVFRELENLGKPELFTIDLAVKELGKIAQGKGRDSRYAKLGLEILKKEKMRVLGTKGSSADSEIERLASEQGFAVATQDRALQRRLKKEGITVFFLRQGRLIARL